MWDDVSDWMERSKDIIKNPYWRTCTHKEHKIIILVIMHSIKLCMNEYLDQGDNCFLRLTWYKKYGNTANIVCMSRFNIASIRKKFMEEGNLIDPRKVK